MFIYRPHVHQLDGTITPDIVVVGARIPGQSSPAILSDLVQLEIGADLPEVSVVPATLLVAAGYGTLLAPAFALKRKGTSDTWLCLIGRTAWRLSDVEEHPDRLEMSITWSQSGASEAKGVRPNVKAWQLPGQGLALCVAEPALRPDPASPWCAVQLRDPVRGRSLQHRIDLKTQPREPT